jgi:predicted MFS family arabinose efflux permease
MPRTSTTPRAFTWVLAFCFATEGALYSAVTPLLPLLTRTVPLTALQAGVLLAGYSGGLVMGSVLCVPILKRYNARGVALLSLLTLAATTAVFGCASTAEVLSAARLGQGVAAGCMWTACLSWLLALWPAERRGEAMGIAVGPAVVGTVAGPAIGSVAVTVGVTVPYAGVAALCVCAAVALRLMPSPSRAGDQGPTVSGHSSRRHVTLATLGAATAGVAGIVAGLVNLVSPLVLLRLGASDYVTSAVFLAAAIITALTAKVVGVVVDRFRGDRVAAVTLVLTCALLPVLGAGVGIVCAAVAATILLLVNMQCYIAAATTLTRWGEAAGWSMGLCTALIACVWGIGETLGAVIAGAAVESIGFLWTTSVGALLVFVAVVVVIAMAPYASRAEQAASPSRSPS